MTEFARRVPGLQDLFPSSGKDTLRPRECSEVVQLTHDFPGRMFRLESLVREDITAGPALTPSFSGPAQPPSTYDDLVFGQVSHNSATVRQLRVGAFDPGGLLLFFGVWDAVPQSTFIPIFGSGAGAAGNIRVWPRYAFIPPGWSLFFDGDTAGVAYSIFLQIARVRKTLAEPVGLG